MYIEFKQYIIHYLEFSNQKSIFIFENAQVFLSTLGDNYDFVGFHAFSNGLGSEFLYGAVDIVMDRMQ